MSNSWSFQLPRNATTVRSPIEAQARRRRPAARRIRALRRVETARVMARLYAAARLLVNFLPAVIQAQGEAPRGCQDHQTLSSACHAMRTCTGPPETPISGQAPSAPDLSDSRSHT